MSEKVGLLSRSDYINLDNFTNREASKREERKWETRFWLLLALVAIFMLSITTLLVISFNKYRDDDHVASNCSPGQTVKTGAFNALPVQLQSQLKLSVPAAGDLKQKKDPKRKPNILVFLADDMGYGDLSVYGHPTQPWGPLDEMASKGMRFSQFYADTVCTPSRAQLLTGRIAVRSGMKADNPRIFVHGDIGGLPDSEITIPEMLKDAGYATGFNGKWHLGINCNNNTDGCHLPFNHGFDEIGTYFPLSNNLACDESKRFAKNPSPTACFLYRGKGTEPWQAPAYHETLTDTLVNETKAFITKNRDNPWFYFFASPQPHDATYSSKRFKGSTSRGDYGDTVNEMNWAAGELLRHINSLDLAQDTLIFFYSDNGGADFDCEQGGNNGMLKMGKGSFWEGGVRVDAFAYWPGTIPEGVVSQAVLTSADLLPTIANLTGLKPPTDRIIDGLDMTYLLLGDGVQSASDADRPIFHYCGNNVHAVRYKDHKIHYVSYLNNPSDCYDGVPRLNQNPLTILSHQNCSDPSLVQINNPPLIFNLVQDPSEKFPLDPSTRQDLLDEVAQIVSKQQSTIGNVPNQLTLGFRVGNIPCKTPQNNCVFNYPLESDFDFSGGMLGGFTLPSHKKNPPPHKHFVA